MRTMLKWIHRCLGWIVLACVAVGALCGYLLHRKVGYGAVEPVVTWRDKALPLDQMAGDCELLVGGKRRAWAVGKGVRLRPGPAVIELRVRGFRASSASVGVVKDTVTVAKFNLDAAPCTITVNNVKSNGVVNGKPCGGKWVLQGAEVGRSYAVEVAAPGYHTNHLALLVEKPGQDLVTNLVWQPLMGFVRVSVTPPGRESFVFIDGAMGSAEGDRCLEVGLHSLSVSNVDYYPYEQRFEVTHGGTNDCHVLLKPRPASLKVEANPGVQYEVKDGSGGVIPFQGEVAELFPGTRTLTINAKGYVSQEREFVIRPNGQYSWKVTLEKKGLPDFRRVEARFQGLTNANWGLLEENGGREWQKIREIRVNDQDLIEGGQQYAEACANLTTVIEKAKALGVWKERFRGLTNANWGLLEADGGHEWKEIRELTFGQDLVEDAKQYARVCTNLTILVDSIRAMDAPRQRFQSLTNANWVLLEEKGAGEWKAIREARFSDQGMVDAAKRYAEAGTNVGMLVESIKALDMWKQRFESVVNAPNDRAVLDEFGGSDWQQLRLRAFDCSSPGRGAQEYKDAYSALTALVGRCYEARSAKKAADEEAARKAAVLASEQRDLLDRAQRVKDRINQSFSGRTGDSLAWAVKLKSITKLVDEYEQEFGEGTQYKKWFGSVDDEVRGWRRRIELSGLSL